MKKHVTVSGEHVCGQRAGRGNEGMFYSCREEREEEREKQWGLMKRNKKCVHMHI